MVAVLGLVGLIVAVSTTGVWFVFETVHVNVSVSVAVPSDTVIVTLWVPALVRLSVPEMTPVVGLMLTPPGRLVAL